MSARNFKIAYLTSVNPKNVKLFSGVYYYQGNALSKYFGQVEYVWINNPVIISLTQKFYNLYNRIFKKKFCSSHSILISKLYGWIFSRKLKNKYYDLIFADKASQELAYLKTSIPIVYSTDAFFAAIYNYYPSFSELHPLSIKAGNKVERKAIEKSKIIICTSKWAANSAINSYATPVEKINIVSRAANIENVVDKQIILEKRKSDTLKLVFIGVEWQRKGGAIAYNTYKLLKRKINTTLTIIGCNPNLDKSDKNLIIIPYLNKSKSEDMERYNTIMLNSDFLLLPTRAECFGIVFSEASSFGLPCISSDTGGVSSAIKQGKNGYILPLSADENSYAQKILGIYNDDQEYYNLIRSTREEYDTRLNWNSWGFEIQKILNNAMAG
ncbi:MAG: glycosyltransferase family 4 protein [Bacteroidales bacterium]|nr:glycosyltransferase family 4 protein [Bacteroidales bacterium]